MPTVCWAIPTVPTPTEGTRLLEGVAAELVAFVSALRLQPTTAQTETDQQTVERLVSTTGGEDSQ